MYIGVKVMQYFLKHDGFLNDKADGYFGANTLAAVKEAQRHYGLVVDGICGPNTWNKIYYFAIMIICRWEQYRRLKKQG